MDVVKGRGYVYSIQYHIVWCVKYRRDVLNGQVATRLKELLTLISKDNGFQILDMNMDENMENQGPIKFMTRKQIKRLTLIFKYNGFQIFDMNLEVDHIRMLINCTPQHYIPNIIKAMKGVSARLLMKEFGDDLRSKLWGGHLWNPSYFVATVSENTEEQIIEYIRSPQRK